MGGERGTRGKDEKRDGESEEPTGDSPSVGMGDGRWEMGEGKKRTGRKKIVDDGR
jgi:hypothetical protein